MITILVAYDENRAIGNKGKLPWHISEDLKLFKKRTMFHPIIMGRNTWESLPNKPLIGRLNIVLSSRNVDTSNYCWKTSSTIVSCDSLEKAVNIANVECPNKEVFIIGGGKIYVSALEKGMVDRVLVSKVKGKYEGDIYFPELSGDWTSQELEDYKEFKVIEYKKGKNV